jgi:hypothetical protein
MPSAPSLDSIAFFLVREVFFAPGPHFDKDFTLMKATAYVCRIKEKRGMAMKRHPRRTRSTRTQRTEETTMTKRHIQKQNGWLALAAVLLAGSASAQNRPMPRTAPERHFTVRPDIPNPVVLQTEPDAACDLHAAGVNDPAHTMRLYGNIEGYVRFHFTPIQDIQDVYLQLDCTTQAAVTNHPLHLRIAQTPTEDMPAPQGSIPAPKGSTIRPALTDAAARQLSDEAVIALGHPPRPDATAAPEAYAAWLDQVSRPVTILPPHSVTRADISHSPPSVNRADISHSPQNVRATLSTTPSTIWSGFIALVGTGFFNSFGSVDGSWRVPSVRIGPSGQGYSSVLVGLDGWITMDLVAAGTEQDAVYFPGIGSIANYYVWTQVQPTQSNSQEVFSVNSSDLILVNVWVGDSAGQLNIHGRYAWFSIGDSTSGQEIFGSTPLGKDFLFSATSADWIVGRSSSLYDLPDYGTFGMVNADFFAPGSEKGIPYSNAAQLQPVTMRELNMTYPDNNVLSTVSTVSGHPDWMTFFWKNFH